MLQFHDHLSHSVQHLIRTITRKAVAATAPGQIQSNQLRGGRTSGPKLMLPKVTSVGKSMQKDHKRVTRF